MTSAPTTTAMSPPTPPIRSAGVRALSPLAASRTSDSSGASSSRFGSVTRRMLDGLYAGVALLPLAVPGQPCRATPSNSPSSQAARESSPALAIIRRNGGSRSRS